MENDLYVWVVAIPSAAWHGDVHIPKVAPKILECIGRCNDETCKATLQIAAVEAEWAIKERQN